jgi:hypothetical protein
MVYNNVEVVDEHDLTVSDSQLKLDDILLLTRCNRSVTVLDAMKNEDYVEGIFYGRKLKLTVSKTQSIADLKLKIAGMLSLTVEELRIVQCGTRFEDDASIQDLQQIPFEILRQLSTNQLSDPSCYNGKLVYNCPCCCTDGGLATPRPMCNECNQESVIYSEKRKCWSDYVGSTGLCMHCSPEGKKVNIYWGFFCESSCCKRRCSTHPNRDMISIYDSTKDLNSLMRAINSCYAYSSSAARIDASAVDQYSIVPVPVSSEELKDVVDLTAVTEWSVILNGRSGSPVTTKEEKKKSYTRISQKSLLQKHIHAPDIFIVKSDSSYYKFIGMPAGFALCTEMSADIESSPSQTKIYKVPSQGTHSPMVLVRIPDNPNEGKPWYKKQIFIGKFAYNPLTGWVDVENYSRLKEGVERLQIQMQPLKPLGAHALKELVNWKTLALRRLGEANAVHDFLENMKGVDDMYAKYLGGAAAK